MLRRIWEQRKLRSRAAVMGMINIAHLRHAPARRTATATGSQLHAAMVRARLNVHRLRFRTENLLDSTLFIPFISIMY